MHRFTQFLRCAALIGFGGVATQALACNDDAMTLEMRDAIYANDIHRVEATFVAQQAAFEAGEVTADEMRCLLHHFSKSRPETGGFVEAWRDAYPASPYAMTARAWHVLRASTDMRGEDIVARTYPEALRLFNEWQREGWGLAALAYDANPRFIPASDYIIGSANPMNAKRRSDEVFRAVMESDPNYGTYRHARNRIIRGWGWSWREAERFCDTYGPLYEKNVGDDDPSLICQLRIAPHFGSQKHDWKIATLKTLDRTDLDYLWMWYLTRMDATPEQVARAHAVIADPEYLNYADALRFDENVAASHGYDFVSYDVRLRQVERATAELDHDPYNPTLIGWLTDPVMKPGWTEDGLQKWDLVNQIEPREETELTSRLLVRKPYHADTWSRLKGALLRERQVVPHGPMMALTTNEVVYSNHRIDVVNGYIGQLIRAYGDWKRFEPEGAMASLPEEAQRNLSIYYNGVDIDRDFLCPLTRALRLHDVLCEGNAEPACFLPPMITSSFAVVEEQVQSRGVCTTERLMPREALFFTPVPLPEFE